MKGTDRCYYGSNANRKEAIAALREWLAYQDKVENWMKHDDGPPLAEREKGKNGNTNE